MATDDNRDSDEKESPTAARGLVVSVVVLAVLVAAGLVGAVGFVAVDAYLGAFEDDEHEESARRRVALGQRVGPDGDACWSENDGQSSGRVFCDLVSIGDLRWDASDVRVAEAVDINVGSGYMCLVDEDGAPRCWEWSPDVQPRPARVPQDAVLYRIRGADGFACGQTSDYVTVVCWTVGTDQQSYQQASHRFDDDPQWVLLRSYDSRAFDVLQVETGEMKYSHAFP